MSIPKLGPPGSPSGLGNYGAWHTLKIGGTTLPGKWRVLSGGVKLKIDPKKKAGVDGGNPVFHGMNPQGFEIEGEQYSDDERDALQSIFGDPNTSLMPQPGKTQNQYPLQLQHPSVLHFGYAINVMVVGVGILEHSGPGTTKIKISLQHWLQPKSGSSASQQPNKARRAVNNDLGKSSQKNSPPSQQQDVAGPPKNFTPGQGS